MSQEIKTNYISVDKKSALSSYGETFLVGEKVKHDDEDAGEAAIMSFEVDESMNEVKVNTDKGYAHIDFIRKLSK